MIEKIRIKQASISRAGSSNANSIQTFFDHMVEDACEAREEERPNGYVAHAEKFQTQREKLKIT